MKALCTLAVLLALGLPAEAQTKRQQAKLRRELSPYDKWLTSDVAYILTDEERRAWKNLATGDEREAFVEQFWLRRDPTPDTVENEYKEDGHRPTDGFHCSSRVRRTVLRSSW
jgi:hypothetical protein